MRITRLFQPRNPKFWLLLALNGLSAVLTWLLHTVPLAWPVAVVLALFALGNALLGLVLLKALLQTPR